jgi:hypothetical protein
MADAAQEVPQEFWQPPVLAAVEPVMPEAVPMAEACPHCGTEFLMGARFCHTCGGRRPELLSPTAKADVEAMAGYWRQAVAGVQSRAASMKSTLSRIEFPAWLSYLHFHEIQRRVGLCTASLIAFIIGLACIGGALLVGLLTAKTLVDWQAIQYYRAEWLLGATACFVAGILLKKPSRPDSE